jgi:DNA-binding PadR family transcriptional regulator
MLRGSRSMANKPSKLVQGTLHKLILKTLALEPMHGYGIAARLVVDKWRRTPES